MAVDFKKKEKQFYGPGIEPELIQIPTMNFLAVEGTGDPNEENGAYKEAVELLYGIAYTLRMSQKSGHEIPGYFEYVVPPLEGFWWQEGVTGMDESRKKDLCWISLLRLPDFVTEEEVEWAKEVAKKKKKREFSKVKFFTHEEGLCIQCMHIGPYATEQVTLDKMLEVLLSEGREEDFSPGRYHHEIYLNDPRKTSPEKQRTIIRHPVR